jgi:phenolic acid decarboxylase
LHEWKRD